MSETTPAAGARRSPWPALAAVLLLVLVPRLVHLSADPPINVSPTSCGDYGDPASYASSARNKVLFGHAKVDNLDAMVGSPVGHTATYLIFSLLGVGMRQMNLQPVLFSLLLFACLFFIARAYFADSRSLFFFLLLLNYPFLIYGRIADQVMPMTLFAVLGLFLFLKGWEKPAYFYLSAVCLGLSFMAKAKAAYFLLIVIPLTAAVLLILRREAARLALNVKRLAYFGAGALTTFLPWLFFVYLPGREFLAKFGGTNAAHMIPRTASGLVEYWLFKPPLTFYRTNRLLALVLFLYFFSLLVRIFNKRARAAVSELEIACSVWFVVGVLSNSVIGYRPTRHYIEMTIPMIILAGLFLKRALAGVTVEFEPQRRPLFYAVLFALLWVAVSSLSPVLFSGLDILDHPYRCLLLLTGLAVAAFGAAAALIELVLVKRGISIPRRVAVPVIVVALAVYGIQNVMEYGGWLRSATYNLKSISRDLGRAFPSGTVFCGLETPAISMENRNVAHIWYPNFANSEVPDFLNVVKVKYLFLADFNKEAVHYWEAFPDVMKRARFRVRYRLWVSWFDLYEIGDSPVPEETDTGLCEAEQLDREVGLPLFDPGASNQFAVRVESGQRGVVLQKRLTLKPGDVVDGRLFIRPDKAAGGGPLALIQLDIGKGVHYHRYVNVYDPETQAGHGFLEVPFRIDQPRVKELTYRLKVIALGNWSFSLDKVEIRIKPAGPTEETSR